MGSAPFLGQNLPEHSLGIKGQSAPPSQPLSIRYSTYVKLGKSVYVLLLGALAAFSVLPSAQAATGSPPTADEWTWNNATHPAGSAAVNGGTSGGGVWLREGIYYIPGVGHMDELTEERHEIAPTGAGMLGKVSHSTGGGHAERDLGLIATGTRPISPQIRVSDAWQDAPISDVAHDVIPKGATVCHSGTSSAALASGGSRCGVMKLDCSAATGNRCIAYNVDGLVQGGDSGGPVWWYDGMGGVHLYGWVRGQLGVGDDTWAADGTARWMSFEPVWNLQNYDWSVEESWSAGGYPSGNSPEACFVTTQGCIRS